MGNVLELLFRIGYHILFLILAFIGFYLVVNYNNSQKEIFINTTNILASSVNGRIDKFNSYLDLKEENAALQKQNSILLQALIGKTTSISSDTSAFSIDSLDYSVIPVTICNSTHALRNNNLTLCQGSDDGISSDMGVISEDGIVGIVRNVSKKYSRVMSILHSQSVVDCSIKSSNAHGSLTWNGVSPKLMNLIDIPKHIKVKKGDTVQTSGYSTLFPKGLNVGKIDYVGLENGSNSWTIKVELFNDLATISRVYVIKNKLAAEQIEIEKPEQTNE